MELVETRNLTFPTRFEAEDETQELHTLKMWRGEEVERRIDETQRHSQEQRQCTVGCRSAGMALTLALQDTGPQNTSRPLQGLPPHWTQHEHRHPTNLQHHTLCSNKTVFSIIRQTLP